MARITTHTILSVRRKLPRVDARVEAAYVSRSCARTLRATAHTLHRSVAFGRHSLAAAAAVPPFAIHFHYVLVLARAHAFNYIFASQLPRERKTGRDGPRRGRGNTAGRR